MSSPRLTVALITPDDFSTIHKTVGCVAAQSVAREIELLVLTPDPERLHADENPVRAFHSLKVVPVDLSGGSGPVRGTAVREASAPIIVFGEDHCYPESDWAESLLRAHADDWAAVGPVVKNANPETLVSWADLLMGYGPWLAPGKSGERDHLPGHNSSYKTDALLSLGSSLDDLMEAESALQWKLRSMGLHIFQESAAQVAHTNFARWGVWLPVSFHAGRVFAATRAMDWSRARRLAFAASSPLIPLVRLLRHLRQAFHAGLSPWLIARVAPVLLLGLVFNAAGEAAGAVAGAGESRSTLVEWDFHRNVPRETARLAKT